MTAFAIIIWSLEDIKELKPDWSDEMIKEAAKYIKSIMEDRSIEVGWEILNDALDMFEADRV